MKFVVTDELGRLARWLRILGYDTIVSGTHADVAILSLREERIILTRDSKMSRFSGVRMVHVTSDFVAKQLAQVVGELRLAPPVDALFSRCVLCNRPLEPADKAAVKKDVPAYVYQTNETFVKCASCGRVYWKGTHWQLAKEFLEKIQEKDRPISR